MFPGFWGNLIIVMNFWPMDVTSQKKRNRGAERTEKQLREKIEEYLNENYKEVHLKYTFIDLMFDPEDDDEVAEYKSRGENFI